VPRGIPKTGKRVNRAAQRRASRPATIDENQFYSVGEVAAATDSSVATVNKRISIGALRAVKDGARTKVLGAEIIRHNQQRASAAS
jgi:hypothetical protein